MSEAGRKEKVLHRLFSWTHYLYETLMLAAAGVVIGVVVSLFEVVFSYGLQLMNEIHHDYGSCWWLLSLPFAGLLIAWMFSRFGKTAKQGMSLVFKINQGKARWIPKRTITLMTLATWLSQLAGASVGKEGVGMQIGATVSHVIGRSIPFFKKEKTVFLITGMAAGFAGLFGTPFTSVFFAMEVLVSGALQYRALAPAICAALSASMVSAWCGLSKEAFYLADAIPFDLGALWWKLLLLGILFGAVGGLFAWSMHQAHHFFETRFPSPYRRIFFGGIGAALLLWICMDGRYSGSGMNLITAAFTNGAIYPWDFALKFFLSMLCLSVGFIGGEVTPLFAIGSSLGFVLAGFFGLPPAFGAALGYAAVFGAGTNTWLASMMIGMEIFGWQFFPFFFVVCSAAYLVNGNLSIYALQRKLEPVFVKEDEPKVSDSLVLDVVPDGHPENLCEPSNGDLNEPDV